MIKSLTGDVPYGRSWEEFLQTCELRDEADGVKFYGVSNCNYVVWPDGTLIQNYGYHGRGLMADVRERGAAAVLASHRAYRWKIDELLSAMKSETCLKG